MPKLVSAILIVTSLVCLGSAALWLAWQAPLPTIKVANTYSNIHSDDYLGPQACATCHGEQHALWQQHSHSRMNLNATEETVKGDFSGQSITYGARQILFDKQGEEFRMTILSGEHVERQYKVTRTVGSRIEQMYIGLQIAGPEPPGHPIWKQEGKLPFGYWFRRRSWLPEGYFDSDRDAEPGDVDGRSFELTRIHQTIQWNETCLYCHNTYPYQHRIHFGEGSGFPPTDLRIRGGAQTVANWAPAAPDKLVTLGISCESCHFGGREHAVERRESRYVPCSPQLSVHPAQGADAKLQHKSPYVINSICSQCHCAKISLYPNGAGTWNSREALDLTSGSCATQLKCTDCHDAHRSLQHGGLLTPEQTVAVCLKCHERFQQSDQLAKHTRHGAATNVSCLDCHMPRIVQGLEDAARTHRISSPTEVSMLRHAAPNACNLCHLDKSLRWTLDELEKGWGRKLTPDHAWENAGHVDQPLGPIWLEHKVPVVRLVAAAAYARSPLGKAELPRLSRTLQDTHAVNRMFGLFAVEEILGRKLSADEYSPLAWPSRHAEQVAKLRETWEQTSDKPDSTTK